MRIYVVVQMSDVLIGYGSANVTAERVENSTHAYPTQPILTEPFDQYRDDQDFRTGIWYELRHHCPHFFNLIARQFPPEPVPATANYNGYKESELCIRLSLAFLGRLFMRLNLIDFWQKAVALIGTSNVGKTKLLEFLEDYFGKYIFQLKNNPEEQFGFETLPNKHLIVVEEINTKSRIPPSSMLSIVCGSKSHPISRKNQTQVDVELTQPFICVGNSFPEGWPDEQGQTTRRFFMMYWDRALRKDEINVNLPNLLEQERPMALVLMMRAYHSLVRTMGNAHVDEIIPEDINRDCRDVIAGSDAVTAFLRESGLVVFDKRGPRSTKRIPIEVLTSEWGHFIEEKYGRKYGSKKLTKKDFISILEVTGAVALIVKEEDRDTGPAGCFGVPSYTHR